MNHNSTSVGVDNLFAIIAHGCQRLIQPQDFLGLFNISLTAVKLKYLTLSYYSLVPESSHKMSNNSNYNLNMLSNALRTFENLEILEIHDIDRPVKLDLFLVLACHLPRIKAIKLYVISSLHQKYGINSFYENKSSSSQSESEIEYDSDDSVFRSNRQLKSVLLNKPEVSKINNLVSQMGQQAKFIYFPVDRIEY
ncbi:hypothetical protein AYI70_g2438 [Smittium culicis]|uniref:F-box domain-containing protein n=1 Tax=Smittium culicis TaxID=133412 RepID=A0A1R1Y8B3_9FUNG|nr:hypothetical protein AYI70_g2438 [Smittium culicis]